MKEAKKTYVGAAVFFERLADDGWSDDLRRPYLANKLRRFVI